MNAKEKMTLDQAIVAFDNGELPYNIQRKLRAKLDDYKEYLIYRELANIIEVKEFTAHESSKEEDIDIINSNIDNLMANENNEFLDDVFKSCLKNSKDTFNAISNVDIPFMRYLVKTNSPFIVSKDDLSKEKYPRTYKQYVDVRRFMGARKVTKDIFSDLYDEYCRFRREIAVPYLNDIGTTLYGNKAGVIDFKHFMNNLQSSNLRPYTSKYFFFINTGDYPTNIIKPTMVKNGILRGNDLDRDMRGVL